MHSRKKMLHLQEKSCIYKKILHLQKNLAKARKLCICNKILQKQEYLSTKYKGAMSPLDPQQIYLKLGWPTISQTKYAIHIECYAM